MECQKRRYDDYDVGSVADGADVLGEEITYSLFLCSFVLSYV